MSITCHAIVDYDGCRMTPQLAGNAYAPAEACHSAIEAYEREGAQTDFTRPERTH